MYIIKNTLGALRVCSNNLISPYTQSCASKHFAMSSNGSHAPGENVVGSMGGSGIRLPPISFLSRDNQNQVPLTSMLPITQRPLGKLQVPTQSIRANILEEPSGISDEKDKMSLPSHRAMDIYSPPQLEPNPPSANGGPNQHNLPLTSSLSQQQYVSRMQTHGEANLGTEFALQNGHPAQHNYAPVGSHVDQPHQEQNYPNGHNNGHSPQFLHPHQPHAHHLSQDEASQPSASETRENGPVKSQEVVKSANQGPRMDRKGLNKVIDDLFPRRRHLGTIMYNPTTTWSTLQIEQLHGLDWEDKSKLLEIQRGYHQRISENYAVEEETYIPVIPPLPEAYVNSFIDVKIPYRFVKEHLSSSISGKVQRRRELWGGFGDIYTDDSELLSVLTHLGLFNNALDLSGTNPSWAPKDIIKPLQIHYDNDGFELLDLSVTLLLLPPLLQYHGFYRNGINSRSWLGGSHHDGLSFGVFTVKWETYLASIDERNLYKQAQIEDAADRDYEKALLNSGTGWKFDGTYYKQLKEKYAKLDDKEGA